MAATSKGQLPLTREAILGASIRLFQQHGFGGLGMRQIADCLKIKAPSLYHHFASKEALARQALEQYREEQMIRLRAIEDLSSRTERLQAYAELFAGMLSDGNRPCMYLVMVREPTFREDACADELKRFAKQNIDWLEANLRTTDSESPARMTMPDRSLAELVFASFEGLMALSLADKNPSAAFRERANHLLQVVLNAATP